jgi:hypothetical protein
MNDIAAIVDVGPQPHWRRYPFAYAAVLGVIILTVLPFLQRGMLRAPPPMASMGDWQLTERSGAPLTNEQLRGRVWIGVPFCVTCPPLTPAIQRILRHTEGDPIDIVMISTRADDSSASLQTIVPASARLRVTTGTAAQINSLLVDKLKLPLVAASADSRASSLALVDQAGDLRGFWPAGDEGVGNLINAARLLAKHGPTP